MKKICFPALVILLFVCCNKNEHHADAYGNFEATEVVVAAEATGRILNLSAAEGMELDAGAVAGLIDTATLSLKRTQLVASRNAVAAKTGNIVAQMDVLKEQKKNLERDRVRFSNLLREKAATQKQLDDIEGQLNVIDLQIRAVESLNPPVAAEIKTIDSQLEQLADQISKSTVRNPVKGTILTKYAEAGEVTAFGKPLYKIANLDTMMLRVYVSGTQLPSIKIGEQVKVFIDKDEKTNTVLEGQITWISSTAEFTPKIIQTKEERVNLVYAVKVKVKNNGTLKIGMPGEVIFGSR